MRMIHIGLTGAVIAALAACGATKDADDNPPPQVLSPAVAAPAASAAPPVSATPAAGSPAPARVGTPARPASPAGPGDLDGDGRADRASLSGDTVIVRASTAGRLTAHITPASPSAPNMRAILGIRDTDGDGYGEVWVRIDTGANTSWVRPVRYNGSAFAEVTVIGNGPLTLFDGGGALGPVRFSCDGRSVHRLSAIGDTSTPTLRYDGKVETFEVNADNTVTPAGTVTFTGQTELPALPGTLSCGLTP